MKRIIWMLSIVAVTCVATAIAQSPGGRGGPVQGRGSERPGGPVRDGRPPIPVIEVLDSDHNGTLSADELRNATTSLLTLDKNKDGKLTEDEIRPPQSGRGPEGPGQPGRGTGGRGQNGPPPGGGRGREREAEGRDRVGGPPPHNPERFVEHALEFDADKDGKLSQEELLKFGEEMGRRRAEEESSGGARPNDGERPVRPKRPE